MFIKISSKFSSVIWNNNIALSTHTAAQSICRRFNTWRRQTIANYRQPNLWLVVGRRQQNHDWKRQMEYNNERRKVIPNLVYLHNPWTYLVTKFQLMKVQLLWDREFVERDFIRGAKQAAVVLTDTIRNQNTSRISKFTTPIGFQQISRDMLLSRNDTRLKLVRFETEHLRRSIPMKVATKLNFGRKYCFIDMLFVGLRNTKDFNSIEEVVEVKRILHSLDSDLKMPHEVLSAPHRIVFAEIFMRFRRDYTDNGPTPTYLHKAIPNENEWAVAFYKILSFDILNYSPK